LLDTRAPVTSSSGGGFQMATNLSPRGEPSSSTSSTGRPHSAEARRAGSPMVAEQKTNVGSAP
jgi:hypothetical protein